MLIVDTLGRMVVLVGVVRAASVEETLIKFEEKHGSAQGWSPQQVPKVNLNQQYFDFEATCRFEMTLRIISR